MSATENHAMFEAGAVAHVNFRVRCERLGHGEEVFLEGDDRQKAIRLFTSATSFPWYRTLQPITLQLPPKASSGEDRKDKYFTYRYAVHRAGVFHRWEQPSDGPQDLDSDDDMATDDNTPSSPEGMRHEVPLRLLQNRESYVVNDVLGVTTGPPNIDHIRLPTQPTYHRAGDLLHSKEGAKGSKGSLAPSGSVGQLTPSPGQPGTRKKAVGFAPAPPPYHQKPTVAKRTVHLNSTDGLVVVSIFLPVIVNRSDAGEWTADWDYEVLLSMQTHLRVTRVGIVKWKGWQGNSDEPESRQNYVPRAERGKVEECLRPFNCVPVWVDVNQFREMYNGFCKGVLWPVLHNITSVYSTHTEKEPDAMEGVDERTGAESQFSEYCMDDVEQGPIHGGRGDEAKLWSAYNTVNRLFAEVIVQCFNEGDLVWVHGFHLLILPSYLARRIPMAKVGIFLHTPFPSSEIFRTVWCREDLLRGMLNADQVGFHLFEYARHFLTCCRRLLGLNYGMIPDSSGGHTLAIDTNGRHVVVTSIHAGVEPPVLNQILQHGSTLAQAAAIRNRFVGRTIFCAVDRMESLKGIPLKLLGVERFLCRCPEWIGKIVLIQVGIAAYERMDDFQQTKTEILSLVKKINDRWPNTVQFQECDESDMRLQQRMALLRAADVVLVTPIRDGLNLIPLEFTIAHQDALTPAGKMDGRARGLCILSEFSSCTRVMRGALHVNPWKISEIAQAFRLTLLMSEDERMRRISCASEFVTRVTTQRWALAVMLDLKGVNKVMNPVHYSGAGLGLGYRLLGMNTGFGSLDFNAVAKSYKKSRARLILVDYGGTIVSNDNLDNLTRFRMVKDRSPKSVPTPQMLDTLRELCSDQRNTVFVVSGKERHSLTKTLGHIPNLGLAAEHGMFISWPVSKVPEKRRWETLVPESDRTWRSLAMSIMEVYTSRTHGSYIEETEMKVLWQYRDADLEFGFLQARELEDHLSKYLRSFPVDILHGGMEEGGYVEVRPKGVNKGVLAMKLCKQFPSISQKDGIDFALVLGDDHCDEPMLSVMRQIGRRVKSASRAKKGEDALPDMPATITLVDVSSCDAYLSPELDVYTCTVGKKPSAAANYLHDVNEVQELLESLVKVSTRDHRYHSAVDLRSYDSASSDSQGRFGWGASRSSSLEISRSLSLGQMATLEGEEEKPVKVSANLKEFLSLESIDDGEEDEEPICF